MAMNKTNFHRDQVINLMRGTTITAPAGFFLAAFLSDPTVTGAAGTEVTAGNYARVALTMDAPSPPGESQNVALAFPAATVQYLTVTHMGIMDAASGGNMWYFGPWDTTKNVYVDDTLQVNAGALQIDET